MDRKEQKKIALYEDELYGAEEQKEEEFQFVAFLISGEWYGVRVEETREIIAYPHITYLPHAPKYIAGITNLRGNILSVTDLKKIFGLPDSEITQNSRIIVVESKGIRTGILADKVLDVVFIPKSKIEPPLETIEAAKVVFLDGCFSTNSKFVGILKIDEIFQIK
ncbi:chemotaxis protein CheW [Candidatus Omnitrophota bacterium]